MDKYIIIDRRPNGRVNITVEQPGRENVRLSYIGYTKREAVKLARQACGLVGRHLTTIEF